MADPTDEQTQIEHILQTHPFTQFLRSNPSITNEPRLYANIPEAQRANMFTCGSLLTPDRLVVPPLLFTGKFSTVLVFYLGAALAGYKGVVHGGFLATILNEGLATCALVAVDGDGTPLTMSLSIEYRKPAVTEECYALRATLLRMEGRIASVEGRIEVLRETDDESCEGAQVVAEGNGKVYLH